MNLIHRCCWGVVFCLTFIIVYCNVFVVKYLSIKHIMFLSLQSFNIGYSKLSICLPNGSIQTHGTAYSAYRLAYFYACVQTTLYWITYLQISQCCIVTGVTTVRVVTLLFDVCKQVTLMWKHHTWTLGSSVLVPSLQVTLLTHYP